MGEGELLNREQLAQKLRALSTTQQSIEGTASWCLFYSKEAKAIVSVWDDEMTHSNAADKRMALLYLANHLLQEGKKKGKDFGDEFARVIGKAIHNTLKGSDEKTRKSVERLVSVWEERRVFGSALVKQLRDAISKAKATPPAASKAENGHGSKHQSQEITRLSELWNSVAQAKDKSTHFTAQVLQLKPKLHTEGSMPEVTAATDLITTCVEALSHEVNARRRLISELKKVLAHQEQKVQETENQVQRFEDQHDALSNRVRVLESVAGSTRSQSPSPPKQPPHPHPPQHPPPSQQFQQPPMLPGQNGMPPHMPPPGPMNMPPGMFPPPGMMNPNDPVFQATLATMANSPDLAAVMGLMGMPPMGPMPPMMPPPQPGMMQPQGSLPHHHPHPPPAHMGMQPPNAPPGAPPLMSSQGSGQLLPPPHPLHQQPPPPQSPAGQPPSGPPPPQPPPHTSQPQPPPGPAPPPPQGASPPQQSIMSVPSAPAAGGVGAGGGADPAQALMADQNAAAMLAAALAALPQEERQKLAAGIYNAATHAPGAQQPPNDLPPLPPAAPHVDAVPQQSLSGLLGAGAGGAGQPPSSAPPPAPAHAGSHVVDMEEDDYDPDDPF